VNGQKYRPPGVFKPADAPFKIQPRYQPYYKLHGSSNWRSADNAALLILGGDKGNDIQKIQLLSWYQMEFARLSQKDARIMVIGYGFGDPHINDMLISAASSDAQFFIVDTSGIGVLASAAGTKGIPSQLKMAMQHSIIGASRRSLKESLYSDTVERTKILKFFN
jgi:SIR2-like domain